VRERDGRIMVNTERDCLKISEKVPMNSAVKARTAPNRLLFSH